MTTPRVLRAQQLTPLISSREIRTVTAEPRRHRVHEASHAIGREISAARAIHGEDRRRPFI
jgi:hypothetical protein